MLLILEGQCSVVFVASKYCVYVSILKLISRLPLTRWAKRCSCGTEMVEDAAFNHAQPTKDEPQFMTSTAESYVKHRQLGEGSFGTVHLARHRPSGMVCAMKVLLRKDCVLDMDANSYREVMVHRQVFCEPAPKSLALNTSPACLLVPGEPSICGTILSFFSGPEARLHPAGIGAWAWGAPHSFRA